MTSLNIPDDSPVAAVAKLRTRFPGVSIWYGNYTRRYWAIVAGQLVEATSAAELRSMLNSLALVRRGL